MASGSRSQIPRPPPSPLRANSGTSIKASSSLPSRQTSGRTSPSHLSVGNTGTGVGIVGSTSSSTLNSVTNPNPNQQQKSRAKDLLRKHYGLGVGPPPPRPVGSNSQDPMDMNSLAFDAKSYYDQLITTSSLPALLKRENELLSEIRHLEGERQSLVYNHHHELIAASDTISAMKTRAESLDGELDLLRVAFSEISRLTAEVSMEQNSKMEEEPPRSRAR